MKNLQFKVLVVMIVTLLTLLSLRRLRAVDAAPDSAGDASVRTPVLIELFTSEGCSSCPPADALLEKLDRSQPVSNADLVVLSEHVDYWDDIGWRDPYSSHLFSIRQGDYAHRFRLGGPYTPQMVVDGNVEFVGSDERRAVQVIEDAAKVAKVPVSLSSLHVDGINSLVVHVQVGMPTPSTIPTSGQILIAVADDSDQSNIRGGENKGRILKHVAVVRTLTQVGTIDHRGAFSEDVRVSAENVNLQHMRVVAIVQEAKAGRVMGVATVRFVN